MQKPRGTTDYFGNEMLVLQKIKSACSSICKSYNIQEMITPVFEDVELFLRSVGEDTDIVQKEIYSFTDKGDRKLALRPEGTASIMRSYIENKLYGDYSKITKLFYFDKMFRYERPQKGRRREFMQFGIEYLNSSNAFDDFQIIEIMNELLKSLNINNSTLEINNIGSLEEREKYTEALNDFLKTINISNLCEDCQKRASSNPFRILDCKKDKDNPELENMPKISNFIGENSSNYFNEVITFLNDSKIPFIINERLIRGLDYYENFVFEIIYDDLTIIAGGRYNNLFKQLSNSKTDVKCIGAAMGIERIIDIIKDDKIVETETPLYIVNASTSKNSLLYINKIAKILRESGYCIDFDTKSKKIKSQFSLIDESSKIAIIIGDEEISNSKVTIKNLLTNNSKIIDIESLVSEIHLALQ